MSKTMTEPMTEPMTGTNSHPGPRSEDPSEEAPDPFGKLIKCVYEFTFVFVVLTLGALAGTVIGVLMPVLFPFVILWQRYVLPRRIKEKSKQRREQAEES
jgi:hypothetical protein